MRVNPLVELSESGQSIWYDGIERGLLTSVELRLLIDEDELRGVTSNPTIFDKAIDSSGDYSDQLCEQAERQKSASEIYEALAVRDIQMAADLLAPVFDKTDGTYGQSKKPYQRDFQRGGESRWPIVIRSQEKHPGASTKNGRRRSR